MRRWIGAAFILLFPIFLDRVAVGIFGGTVDTGLLQNLHDIVFGALIIYLLTREPRGLAAYLTKLSDRLRRGRPAR